MIDVVKRLAGFIFVLFFGFFVTSQIAFVSAQTRVGICPSGDFLNLCEFKAEDIGTVIGNILQILLIIAVVLSVIFLVWGGIKWITSGGDKQAVESARSTIISALIGLIIAFIAFFIISVVLNIFGLSEDGVFTLPTLLDAAEPTHCDPGEPGC